jgi:signal transduction histidine kinase
MTMNQMDATTSHLLTTEPTSAHQLWQRLTLPSAEVTGIEQRRRAQFLAASLLFLIPVAFVGVLLASIFDGDGPPDSQGAWIFFGINLSVVLILVVIYFISRTRYHAVGSSTVVGLLALGALGMSAYSPYDSLTLIPFLSLVALVTSLLFSYRTTLLLAIATNAAGTLTLIQSEGQLIQAELHIIVFNFVMSVMILAAALVRTQHIEEIEQQNLQLNIARATLRQRVENRTRQLSERNEELKRLTYILSHDLRNHLVNFSGFTQELSDSIETVQDHIDHLLDQLASDQKGVLRDTLQEDVPDFLLIIDTSIGQMRRMVDAMLDMARMDALALKPETLATQDLVEDVLKSLSTEIKDHNTTVVVAQLPDIVADRLALERIFSNLIHNAVIYAAPNRKPKISIIGEVRNEETWFQVQDNGIGISDNDIQKIFDIFQRVGSNSISGDGMGLAFVRSLVRRHGGQVKCTSVVGTGTTLSFSIPHVLEISKDATASQS